MDNLRGLYVPLVTPFTADGKIAVDALEGLSHAAIAGGAAGIVALGTTAEVATLDAEEQRTVVEACARVCWDLGATLIVGAGSNDTRRSVEDVHAFPDAAAVLVTVPYFTRPSEAGVIAHFAQLAADSPVPIVVYNIPYRTGQRLGVATLREIAALPGIVGIKHAVGGIDEDTVDLLADPPPGFAILGGDDVFAPALLALGADGAILASAHLGTRHYVELVAAWHRGDAVRARTLGHALTSLASAAFAEPNPTVIKGVLHARGLIPTPDVRLPLLPAQPASIAAVLNRLDGLPG